VSGGTIVAGDLDIESLADGVWTNGTTEIKIADYRIVPGDTLTYTQNLLVTATGDNIQAQAALGTASFTTSSAPADAKLADFLSKNTTVTAVVGTASLTGFTFTALSAKTVTATVTINFPSGTSGDENGAKLGSVNLADVGVVLTQVIPGT